MLRETGLHAAFLEFRFAIDTCKPAAFILDPFRFDGPGALNVQR